MIANFGRKLFKKFNMSRIKSKEFDNFRVWTSVEKDFINYDEKFSLMISDTSYRNKMQDDLKEEPGLVITTSSTIHLGSFFHTDR